MTSGERADVKDILLDGCQVHLMFHPAGGGRWRVNGTVQCGIGENQAGHRITTEPYDSREEAEQAALRRATSLLGKNADRSTSRVRNWE